MPSRRDRPHRIGYIVQAGLDQVGDARRETVTPGSLDQHPASPAIASFGDAAALDLGAARMLRRHQTQPGHQLAGVGEAAEVADLGHQHHRRQEGDAAHRLQSGDDRRHRPVGHQLPDLLAQAVAAPLGLSDCVDLLLQHDLLGRVCEAEPGQPAPVCWRPSLAAREHPIVAQQETQELLPRPSHRLHGSRPRPDKITHGLMYRIRDPDRGQLAGAMQSCQRDRVAAVGFHPVARPHWYQRWGHHRAVVAKSGDLPLQTIAARAGLDAELAVFSAEPLDQAPHGIRLVGDLTLKAHLAQASRFGHGHRDLRLVGIQPHAHRPILVHGSSPMSEARRRRPGDPAPFVGPGIRRIRNCSITPA